MAGVIGAVTAVLNAAVGWVGDVVGVFTATKTVGENTVLANPLLLLFLAIPLVGLGIGLFRRLINVN